MVDGRSVAAIGNGMPRLRNTGWVIKEERGDEEDEEDEGVREMGSRVVMESFRRRW